MKPYCIIIAAFLSVSIAFASDNNSGWISGGSSGDGSFEWECKVSQEVLDKAPRWNPSEGEIPLLPREAYLKAVEAFQGLDIGNPQFESIQLYVKSGASYQPPVYKIMLQGSKKRYIFILVFLDGTVIVPKITKNED